MSLYIDKEIANLLYISTRRLAIIKKQIEGLLHQLVVLHHWIFFLLLRTEIELKLY